MAATPTSTATPYADGQDAFTWLDARIWGDYLRDTGARVEESVLPTDPRLTALLLAASGEVESAALCGRSYDVADLQALTASGAAFLKKMVVYIAIVDLVGRRPHNTDAEADKRDWVEKQRKALRSGEEIFGLVESQEAGVEDLVTRPPINFMTGQPQVIVQADRYFGISSQRRGGA